MSEMPNLLTQLFDPVAFVRGKTAWSGTVAAGAFVRAADQVGDPSATLRWQVDPERTPEGRVASRLRLEGVVPVVCPHCLALAEWPVAIDRLVVWYRSEAAVPEEELEAEDWDARVMDEPITLLELLEEELLLAWPQGAVHEACSLPGPVQTGDPASPFSVLLHLEH
ncbi:hypothetical protein JCM16106_04990 [Hydrogenophilus islandicus]